MDTMKAIGVEMLSAGTTIEQRQELGYGLRDAMLAAHYFPTREAFSTLPACFASLPEPLRSATAAHALLAPCPSYAWNYAHHFARKSEAHRGIGSDFCPNEMKHFWLTASPLAEAWGEAYQASACLPYSRDRYVTSACVGSANAFFSRTLLDKKEHLSISVRHDYLERVVGGPAAVCAGLVTLDANLLATFDESDVRVYAAQWVRTKHGIAAEAFGWIVRKGRRDFAHIEASYTTPHGFAGDLLPRVLPSPKELAKAFRKLGA